MLRGGFKFREHFSLIAMIGLVCAGAVRAQQPVVDKLVLDDTIQSVSAGLLERAIAHANSQGVGALLIEINTPGGLVDSMRTMAGAILKFPRARHRLCCPCGRSSGLCRILPARGGRYRRHGARNQCRRSARRLRRWKAR